MLHDGSWSRPGDSADRAEIPPHALQPDWHENEYCPDLRAVKGRKDDNKHPSLQQNTRKPRQPSDHDRGFVPGEDLPESAGRAGARHSSVCSSCFRTCHAAGRQALRILRLNPDCREADSFRCQHELRSRNGMQPAVPECQERDCVISGLARVRMRRSTVDLEIRHDH